MPYHGVPKEVLIGLKKIESLALAGALADPSIDKSDWIRIWCLARQLGGWNDSAWMWSEHLKMEMQVREAQGGLAR